MAGLTLDSGALIGVERSDRRVMTALKLALSRAEEVTVPSVVVTEVWRGGPRSARIARLLGACVSHPVSEDLAKRAGQALAAVRGSGAIDAIVMASAAERGDAVLTSDADDLRPLAAVFRNVRVLRL